MLTYLWTRKSAVAKTWFVGVLGVQLALFLFAAGKPRLTLLPHGQWTNRELAVLIDMALLLIAAFAMHASDKKRKGSGFQDIHYRTGGKPEGNEQKFVESVLTVESIRAAMTAGLLAILLNDRKDFLPTQETPSYWLSVPDIAADPDAVFFLLIAGALGSSLVTTMGAILCYEYAVRFEWERKNWPKEHLLKKGLHFGKFGFYCLMWSLAVVPVLLDYHVAFLSITFVFVVMWLYYFFPVDPERGESAVDSERVKSVYQIKYPNGKIYIGKDLHGMVNQFCGFATDLAPDQKGEFTVKILWASATASDAEVAAKEEAQIVTLKARDSAIGYNPPSAEPG